MRSKKVEFRMPWGLWQECQRQSKEVGYRSMGKYFVGLAIANVWNKLRSDFAAKLANLPPSRQDAILDELLSDKFDMQRYIEVLSSNLK